MKDLPKFRPRPYERVRGFVERVLSHQDSESYVVDLIAYEDGHYRVTFHPDYFQLTEGHTEPTKSQWNTLKKRFKRHDEQIFMFKEHGETPCEGSPCYYLDFGFFAESRD